ncbi:MAG: flagellar type III secretion system pore protein FliP [Acidobacteria bacterium]|nr:flagellar type III secretion system pore protein FliP [Acidobacteriota bacterium]
MSRSRLKTRFIALSLILIGMALQAAVAAEKDFSGIELRIGGDTGKSGLTTPLQILVLLTLLSLIPAILVSVTSFTRLVIVAHFLRQALGTQTMPPNQVLVGLSLFLTFFIMQPVAEKMNQEALQPMLDGKITEMQALEQASGPLRQFMLRYTREKDLALFMNMAKQPRPRDARDIPMRIVIPSFMISELKTAFQIGFALFIPFLVIDMVVASILLAMGMMQLPPVVVSTPFKILLFVMVDGWNLVIGSLVKSFY